MIQLGEAYLDDGNFDVAGDCFERVLNDYDASYRPAIDGLLLAAAGAGKKKGGSPSGGQRQQPERKTSPPSIVNGVLRRSAASQQQREEENATDPKTGFNPYKAMFSTGTQARAAAASKKLGKNA